MGPGPPTDQLASPVILDGILSDEKLAELLGLQTEYSNLDYKRECDPAQTRDKVELTKDLGAMSVAGGYILIGVSGDGSLSGGIDAVSTQLFDEAKLGAMVGAYMPAAHLASRVLEKDGHKVAMIYVRPHPAGCVFFHARGAYQDGDRDQVTVFEQGSVYWRRGTASSDWIKRACNR